MPSVLAPKSQRRQNASCDRCRHSKRRCLLLPSEEGEHGIACANCKRLGYACTFAFAESSKNSRHKRSSANVRIVQGLPSESLELSFSESDSTEGVQSQSNGLANWHHSNPLSDAQVEIDFDEFLNFNPEYLPDQLNFLATPETTEFSLAPRTDHGDHLLFQDSPPSIEAEENRTRPGHSSIVGRSLNSPVHLLSSSWEAMLLTEHFARIYQTITAGTASIFLDYDCNLYTDRYRYRFDFAIPSHSYNPSFTALSVIPHDPTSVPFTPRTSPSEIVNRAPSRPRTASSRLSTQLPRMHETIRTITILGAVRFLDHFRDLYGNRLSPSTKSQSDDVLKAVLRTFSFQWLATSNSTPEFRVSNSTDFDFTPSTSQQPPQPSLAFVDTWVRTRSLIKNAQPVTSFGVVFATLLFDTIIVPGEALSGLEEDIIRHEFLDTVLQKLAYLERLVEKYCDNLGTISEHGALMESSLSIVRWFAYLRDTVVALMTDRSCSLQEARSHNKGTLILWLLLATHGLIRDSTGSLISGLTSLVEPSENFGSLDETTLASICRRAVPETFSVWRKVVGLRDMTTKQCEDLKGSSPKRYSALTAIAAAVNRFEKCFRPFMNHCRDNLQKLSMASRRFVGMFPLLLAYSESFSVLK